MLHKGFRCHESATVYNVYTMCTYDSLGWPLHSLWFDELLSMLTAYATATPVYTWLWLWARSGLNTQRL